MPLETVGYNPLFPTTNQMKHCWSAFVEYQKCKANNEDNLRVCEAFRRSSEDLCPKFSVNDFFFFFRFNLYIF